VISRFMISATDVLITQKKAPPADDDDRALSLHECVHAGSISSILRPPSRGTWGNSPPISPKRHTASASIRQANRTVTAPWDHFLGDLYATVRANKLYTPEGDGAKIPETSIVDGRQGSELLTQIFEYRIRRIRAMARRCE
jgi:hypothetical protein